MEILMFLYVLMVRYAIFFNFAKKIRFLCRQRFQRLYLINVVWYIHHVWLCSLGIKRSGNIDKNPGPNPNSWDCLSIFHWNLNNIFGHNFFKLYLLRVSVSINKMNIMCFSKSYLNSIISSDNLELLGFDLVCADNSTNTKRGMFPFIIIIP